MNQFEQLHIPVFDTQAIEQLLKKFNADVHNAGWYFRYDKADINGSTSYPADEIPENAVILLGSFDFSYYHDGEIVFHRVVKHNIDPDDFWPDHWEKDQIELLSGDARKAAIETLHIRQLPRLHVFVIHIGSFGDRQYLIAAQGISIHIGTVFYYNRLASNKLEPGE